MQPRRIRVRARHRGAVTAVLLLMLTGALVAFDYSRGGVVLPFGPPDEPAPPGDVEVVQSGTGTIQYADADGPVAGTGGPVLRYRVGVEEGLGLPPGQFAAAVEAILSDPRSWTAGGTLQLQRVSSDAGSGLGDGLPMWDFTVYLASPALSEAMCREDGLRTHQYTSCRLADDRVVINSARWLTGVPEYHAPLVEYRAYVVNHEVGHQLGHQHELCPGTGRPAPVMQQQTFGLDGCTPYGWPYRDGQLYAGPLA